MDGGKAGGGAASPSTDSSSSTGTLPPQINESGAAECCFELFCVALVSVIAE